MTYVSPTPSGPRRRPPNLANVLLSGALLAGALLAGAGLLGCGPAGIDGEKACAADQHLAPSGACVAHSVCEATEYEASPPTENSDRVCALVSACEATEYEASPPTATSDRECAPVSACQATEYEASPPTATSDRECAPLTVCADTEYELTPPTATSDRSCAPAPICAPFDNHKPYLTLTAVTNPTGLFPATTGAGGASGDTTGFTYLFAGPYAPAQNPLNDGRALPIASYQELFAVMGATFGGDGAAEFALPNLAGRQLIGAGPSAPLGGLLGAPTQTPTTANLPAPYGIAAPLATHAPSQALTPLIAVRGPFPSRGGTSGSAAFLGQIAWFNGDYAPAGWAIADGRLLPIASATGLFSIVGTTYGGDGITTFALPDLRDRVATGAAPFRPLGSAYGLPTTTLSAQHLPPPDGSSLSFSHSQPALSVTWLICISGIFPGRTTDSGSFDLDAPTLGQVVAFAGNFEPSGFMRAEGQLLPISTNSALFAILGTTFGGDGRNTFALPDLRYRTPLATGAGPVGAPFSLGQARDASTATLICQ